MALVLFVLVFAVCFLACAIISAIYFYKTVHIKRKFSFEKGVYEGKNLEQDAKISQYLKDDMEHHSSKAFKSINNPDDR